HVDDGKLRLLEEHLKNSWLAERRGGVARAFEHLWYGNLHGNERHVLAYEGSALNVEVERDEAAVRRDRWADGGAKADFVGLVVGRKKGLAVGRRNTDPGEEELIVD